MKKLILNSLLLVGVGFTLAGCTVDSSKTTVAKVGDTTITQATLYDKLKDDYGTTVLQTMIVNDALEQKYGNKVSDSDVKAEYNKVLKQYGSEDALKEALKYYGYASVDSYKETIKQNLLILEMVKANYKITDKSLADDIKNYINFDIIQTSSSDEATKIVEKLKSGSDFSELAKSDSKAPSASSGGKLGWVDITSSSYTNSFINELKKLKSGEYKAISDDSGYYVVKMEVNPNTDKITASDYKDELSELIHKNKASDSAYIKEQIKALLKSLNVKISDKDLGEALAGFGISADGSTTKTSTSTSSKTTNTSDSKSSTSESK